MLWEHERYHGLGMNALVSVCSGNATVIMVWGMNALVRVCSRNTKVVMVWPWMLCSEYALGTRKSLWFGHGCFCQRMLWEHERYHGLGMDALVSVCSGNANVFMV